MKNIKILWMAESKRQHKGQPYSTLEEKIPHVMFGFNVIFPQIRITYIGGRSRRVFLNSLTSRGGCTLPSGSCENKSSQGRRIIPHSPFVHLFFHSKELNYAVAGAVDSFPDIRTSVSRFPSWRRTSSSPGTFYVVGTRLVLPRHQTMNDPVATPKWNNHCGTTPAVRYSASRTQ